MGGRPKEEEGDVEAVHQPQLKVYLLHRFRVCAPPLSLSSLSSSLSHTHTLSLCLSEAVHLPQLKVCLRSVFGV